MVFIVTSNFVRGLDEAFLSRSDVVIEVGLPSADAIAAIIADVLAAMAERYQPLRAIAESRQLHAIAAECVGIDGRQARKLVAQALGRDVETCADPGRLTLAQLRDEANDLRARLDADRREVKRVRAA